MSYSGRKMSLLQATMLVAGNMIGTGVFLLPVTLASVGSIAIFGWVVATVGAAALGLVFAKLGELDPQEGGPYAYARDFLGPYVGFQTNYVYWFGNWIGNIAIAIAAVGYLAEFFPAMEKPPASVFVTAGVIWILTFANILGPRVVGALETWTMSLALIPILGIAVLGWFWFNPETFHGAWNVSGGSNAHGISRAASMALWAYMVIVALCAILKSVGSLGGWMLLVGQSAKAAADDGMFPRVFARLNRNGVPGVGLIIVGVLMTIVLFATMSPTIAGQFSRIIDLAVILAVIPYIYASVAVVKVVFDHRLPARTFQTYKWIAITAVVYCLWTVVGGDPPTVVNAMVALLASVPLYPFFLRSMAAAAERKRGRGQGDTTSAAATDRVTPSPQLVES